MQTSLEFYVVPTSRSILIQLFYVFLTPQFASPDCHRQFTSPQGVHVHRCKMHGVFCPEHHLATCPACLTYLWSTQRLQQHLAYMPRDGSPNACFAYLQQIGYAVSYAAEPLPKALRGQSRFDALPVAGPMAINVKPLSS